MPHREETSTGTAYSDGERKQTSSAGPRQPGPRTQAPGCLVCAAPLHAAAPYYQRIKICKECMGSSAVEFGGKQQRFCQQCSRLHPIDRFDGSLRSCREQLARHAERRRQLRKARKAQQQAQRQAQQQQADAAQPLPDWQLWQPGNEPASKRQRVQPFPACPPATFGPLPPLPMFPDLPAGQMPSVDSVLLSSATAYSAASLLPPFASGPLPSAASVLMPPLPLPPAAPGPSPQQGLQPGACSIEALAAAAELELQQAVPVKVEESAQLPLPLPPAELHLPQQQQQQQQQAAPQSDMLAQLQLLVRQQQGAATQQAQQQQLLLHALLGQQRLQEQAHAAHQGAGTNNVMALLMQLLPHVQPPAQVPAQPPPQPGILQSLPPQQLLLALLQQAGATPPAPPAVQPAPAAPQPQPFLAQLMRSMQGGLQPQAPPATAQRAQPQALPATTQALTNLLHSLPAPAASNPSPQPPSTQAS